MNDTATTPKTTNNPHRKRRPRKSRYGVQMGEKQQLKQIYGVQERQLRNYFSAARSAVEETGSQLVSLLERRLDNAVYRAGMADTRRMARQMATHGLFMVNDRRVDVPSYRLRPGDVISVHPGKRNRGPFSNWEKRMQNVTPPSWILLDVENYSFTVQTEPVAEEAHLGVDIQAIVEFLAR